MVELVVFLLMGGASLLGALTVIRARNPVYAAMLATSAEYSAWPGA